MSQYRTLTPYDGSYVVKHYDPLSGRELLRRCSSCYLRQCRRKSQRGRMAMKHTRQFIQKRLAAGQDQNEDKVQEIFKAPLSTSSVLYVVPNGKQQPKDLITFHICSKQEVDEEQKEEQEEEQEQ